MWKIVAILVAFLSVGLIAFAFVGRNGLDSSLNIPSVDISQPSASPIPFYELTIPGLRSRAYNSNLAQLTKYQDNTNYTSYLTSFDSDGLKINGLLTIPKGQMPEGGWPAIVFDHGYIPPSIYQTTTRYVDHVDYLARNGFVVFKIDYRGNGDSEGEPGGAYYSADYVIDTLNAYSALQNANFVDKNKIGLWGHSMAGNIVARAWAAKPDIPAIVIWAGAGYSYADLIKYDLQDDSYRPPSDQSQSSQFRQKLRDTYGNFDANNSFWQMMAPTNYLKDLNGAIEIHHALDDIVVNIGYSKDLVSLLADTDIPHQFFTYSSGGHNIASPSFTPAMKETVEFFHKYLK